NECVEDRDCPAGSFCTADADGARGCIDPAGKPCVRHEECAASGQTCARDGRCRFECVNDRDCQFGSICCADGTCHAGDCAGVVPRDAGPPPGGDCAPGVSRSCFGGTDVQRNVGTCAAGIQVCGADGAFGACGGGVDPRDEQCDGADDDCDGDVDDGLAGCVPEVTCPAAASTRPFTTYALRGSDLHAGAATFRWELECPPTLPASACPRVADPTAADTEIYLSAAGVFRVRADVTPAGGDPATCVWPLTVGAEGLRVELAWDQGIGRDLDLHLHRWTTNVSGAETDWNADDDCHWMNCKARDDISWRDSPRPGDHADTPDVSACSDAPRGGGAQWLAEGACRNPRLNVDVIWCTPGVVDPDAFDFCAPENIDVDVPVPGAPYRVLVRHFSGTAAIAPTLTVYCGGAPAAVLGRGELVLDGQLRRDWLAADVVFDADGTCRVWPLDVVLPEDPDMMAPLRFGPDWSCRYDAASSRCE
ncbi:MAG: hypothetical protein IT379_42560, partial [Deltaproteobacteria bacterium]|nr:hypothetical protein [Deltaproteobacteria bacterium]